jgi:hypothetical protein
MVITVKPTWKQHLAYQAINNNEGDSVHVTFGGGAGGGKSWFGCEWLIQNCYLYPNTRWFIGREELKRLRDSTLLTFYKVCRHQGLKVNNHFKYNGQDNFIEFENGSRVDLLDLRYIPSDPLYERYGSIEYTGGWIEEGGEIHFDAYDTLKSRVGRHLNDKYGLNAKILITCNPKKNWLYTEFYKKWRDGILEKGKVFIQSLVDDNPYNEKGYKSNLLSIKDVSKKQRLLYGEWEYDDDPSRLIEYDDILNMFTNDFVEEGKKYITFDVARFGRDKTVIGVWSGFRCIKMVTMKSNTIPEAADKINSLRKEYGVPLSHIIGDEGGVGGGAIDLIGCKGFISQAKPINKGTKNEQFNNLKSQCYFKFANRVCKHGYYVVCNEEEKQLITEECEQIKKDNIDKDGKQCIIPKDKVKELIGRSPDYSDMLMMREWFELKGEMIFG